MRACIAFVDLLHYNAAFRLTLAVIISLWISAEMSAQEGSTKGRAEVPPAADRLAEVLKIKTGLVTLLSADSNCDSLERLMLRQNISESVLSASLDVQTTLAEIDHERAQIAELRATLSEGRDRRINWLTVANIIAGTGSGIIGTALQFSDRTTNLGNSIGVTGGAVGVLLSAMALRQQGRSGTLGIAPNMLAALFNQKPELRSIYPDSVWIYLNTAPYADPRIQGSWKEELVNEWERLGRIGPADSGKAVKKIALLTSRIGEERRLSIEVLNDRTAMLCDLRARVSLMSAGLRDLMTVIRTRTVCALPSR